MDATSRERTFAGAIRQYRFPGSLVKNDIRAAVNAMDDFLEANAAAINAAFPQPFRSTASTADKAAIIAFVAMRRAGMLQVTEDN